MKLYGRFLSPFVRRVAATLESQGMAYEHVAVAPFDEWDRAQSINPVVRIPALELDNGEVLIDSNAILDHLDEAAGAATLTPQSGKERRDVMKLVATAVGAMEKTVGAVYETRFHAKEKVEDTWVERCENQAISALQALDGYAAKAGDAGWLFGDKMTQADISATIAYSFAAKARPSMGVAEKAPNLAKFAARMEATPAFTKVKI